MSLLLRGLGVAAVPHSFRSRPRDWAADETDRPRGAAEAALAQKVCKPTQAVHRRADLFGCRRRLMGGRAEYPAGRTAGTET